MELICDFGLTRLYIKTRQRHYSDRKEVYYQLLLGIPTKSGTRLLERRRCTYIFRRKTRSQMLRQVAQALRAVGIHSGDVATSLACRIMQVVG